MAAPGRTPTSKRKGRAPAIGARVDAAVTPEVSAVLARFRVVFSSVRAHNRQILEECAAGALHVRALAMMSVHPGIGVSSLARALLIHQPSASRLVDELVERGLANRRRSARDQRVVELTISAAGRRVLARAPQPLMGVLPDAVGSLSAAQRRALHGVLGELLEHMSRRIDAAKFDPIDQT